MPKKSKPTAPLVPLTGKQKSFLRSLAHKLKPVVQIGHHGVTDGVLAALEVALERHELVKVKLSAETELDAREIAPDIERATKCQLAQVIGHTLVLYRRRAENPKIVLPRIKSAKEAAALKLARKAPVAGRTVAADADALEGGEPLEDFDEFEDEDDDEDLE